MGAYQPDVQSLGRAIFDHVDAIGASRDGQARLSFEELPFPRREQYFLASEAALSSLGRFPVADDLAVRPIAPPTLRQCVVGMIWMAMGLAVICGLGAVTGWALGCR